MAAVLAFPSPPTAASSTGGASQDLGVGSKSAQARRVRPNLTKFCRKTKLCAFELRGMCKRGQACTFAHDPSEIQAAPDLACTKLCPNIVNSGECLRGTACRFAHSESEVRRLDVQDFEVPSPPDQQAEPERSSMPRPPASQTTAPSVVAKLNAVTSSSAMTQREMALHLIGIFQAIYASRPDTEQRVGVPPEFLGLATAAQAWEDAGLHGDARLKFEDVAHWCALGAAEQLLPAAEQPQQAAPQEQAQKPKPLERSGRRLPSHGAITRLPSQESDAWSDLSSEDGSVGSEEP